MHRPQEELPLAQVEDREALIRQYRTFDSRTLKRWSQVIVGPHREAMEAILRERGEKFSQ